MMNSRPVTKLMIYRAAGYTGRMATANAKNAGVDLVIAGRPQDEAKFAALAAEFGVEYRLFAVDDHPAAMATLHDIGALLNCAVPFMRTAEPLMKTCIAAELDSDQLAEKLDHDAIPAGVMLLPRSGGSVAMLGSLAAHAAKRVTNPRSVSVALHVAGGFSRGSAVSASENISTEVLHRVDGKLLGRTSADLQDFHFGDGPASAFPMTLPDLITIWRATDIPNIETYVYVTEGALPEVNNPPEPHPLNIMFKFEAGAGDN